MQLTQQHIDYWQRNLRLTAILLAIWFVVTYVMAWYAIPLAEIKSSCSSRTSPRRTRSTCWRSTATESAHSTTTSRARRA